MAVRVVSLGLPSARRRVGTALRLACREGRGAPQAPRPRCGSLPFTPTATPTVTRSASVATRRIVFLQLGWQP